MKQTGYKMKEYGIPTKRYCQTLDLKDDPELISEYRKRADDDGIRRTKHGRRFCKVYGVSVF